MTIPVSQISPAERTIVAIARATSSWTHTRNVLVLDEPTATLHGDEANRLRAVVRDLANDGVGIIYISHHLSEVVELADRAIVLRNGVVIADERRGSFDESSLVEAISGGLLHSSDRDHSRTVSNGEVRLEVDSLRTRRVAHADISVRSGEIVGLAGLVGSGREEVLAGIFGAREASMRSMTVSGKPVLDHSPHGSVKAGLGFVPADRKSLGSIPLLSARENLTIASLPRSTLLKPHLDSRAERRSAAVELGALSVHPLEPERRFNLFSGGNQQKIVIAKWLRTNPMVLLMDEPTQGVDVAARAGIHALLREMSKSGMAFLIASSDEDELAQICDRVLVLRNGRIAEELVGDQITEQDIVRASLSSDRVGNEMEVK